MVAVASSGVSTRLDQAVDALVAASIDGFSTHALGEDLVDIRRSIDRLEAEFVRRLHRFHQERGAQSDGGGTTMSWIRHHCGMTVKAAAYRVHLARTLGELPASLDSARAGRASFGNVAMIGHLAEDVGLEQVAPVEPILVQAAETFEPAAMRTLVQATRLRLDPDGVLADANHAHERRWFECDETYGGDYIVRGQLDPEGGALLKQAIEALAHGLTRGEERSASQRRADALVDLAAAQLRWGDHRDVHGQRPHLTVTVPAETLRAGSGSDAVPAVLDGVGPIHPETARRIACDAVRTVVTVAPLAESSASAVVTPADAPIGTPVTIAATAETLAWTAVNAPVVPLSVGRGTRTIPAPIRTALRLRDKGCRFPECDRKPAWTDGHHIIHWVDGGPTELENLVSLCRPHHRRVHEEGWRIRIENGVAIVEPPGYSASSVGDPP